MRWPVRQSVKGGRVSAFIQYYDSKICDDILKIISEELNVTRNIFDIIEAYVKYKNNHLEIIKEEYENQFNNYRNEGVEEKEKYINENLSQIPIHQLIKQIKLDDSLWDYDANSLYRSAMWDENSIYPRTETGYAYTPDMNKKLVKKSIRVVLLKEVQF